MIFPGFPGVLSFFQVFQVFQVKWEPWRINRLSELKPHEARPMGKQHVDWSGMTTRLANGGIQVKLLVLVSFKAKIYIRLIDLINRNFWEKN